LKAERARPCGYKQLSINGSQMPSAHRLSKTKS
jgi:hypothetical protein